MRQMNFGNQYRALDINARPANAALEVRENTAVHPLFGHITTDPDGVTYTTRDTLKQEYDDYVGRELGFSKQIIKNNRVLTGLAAPGDYLLAKNRDLKRISDDCAEEYRGVYVKFINTGYSMEEARNNAMKAAQSKKDYLMKQHEMDFPTDVAKQAKDKLKNQVDTNNF